MAYTRTYTLDPTEGGDTVKVAIATKLDGDLTNIFADLTTHEAMTTNAHGVGSGTVVGTTLTQTLTNKTLTSPTINTGTLSTPTISGVATLSSATLSGGATLDGTFTGGTLASCTMSGTVTGSSATYLGGTVSGVTMTGTITGTNATYLGGTVSGVTMTGTITTTGASFGAMTLSAPTLTGTVTASGATIVSPTLTGATLAGALTLGTATMTANYRAFVNAGATAPEWANGIYIGESTRALNAASADVAYTGVGFKPSKIIFIGAYNGGTGMTVGIDDATNHIGIYDNYANNANSWGYLNTMSITFAVGAGCYQQAIVKTMDSDGFTLTWTKAGSPGAINCSFAYIAFR